MVFTPKTWEMSNLNEEDYKSAPKQIEEGEQYILINDVEFDPATKVYAFEMTSLMSNTSFRQKQYMTRAGDPSAINYYALKWMNALGYACCGIKTVLQADEMKGCVFYAEIKMEPSWKDRKQWEQDIITTGTSSIKTYPTISADSIRPIPSDMLAFSEHYDEETGEPDQFTVD